MHGTRRTNDLLAEGEINRLLDAVYQAIHRNAKKLREWLEE